MLMPCFFHSIIAPAPKNARRIAQSFHDGETLLKLLRIAEDYDWMAMRAAAIELQQADKLARPFAKKSAA
jgi:hypothetical protein